MYQLRVTALNIVSMDIDSLTQSHWRLSDEDDSDSGILTDKDLGGGPGEKETKEAEDADVDDLDDDEDKEEELEDLGFHEEEPEKAEEEF